MPKSGDKVIVKGRSHSNSRDILPLIDDLNVNPWVTKVASGRMRHRKGRKERKLEIKVKWYNKTNSIYKLEVSTRDYIEDLFVTVDPRRRLFLERFARLY
jgi:hypothetical protein